MIRNKHIFTILFLILASLSFGQTNLSLEEAIKVAIENNFNLDISDKQIEIAQNNDSWARAGRAPIIDLVGGINNNLVNDQNPASFLQGTYFAGAANVGVNVQWLAYGGGRVKILKSQLEKLVSQEALNKENNVHLLIRDVIQAYRLVQFQEARSFLLQENLKLSKDQLEYEETKRAFGASNSYNITQFEVAYLTDSISWVNQINLIETAKRQLNIVLNNPEYEAFEVTKNFSVSLESLDKEKLHDILNEENYTLKTITTLQELNAINTRLEQSFDKPSVNISAGIGFTENAFKFFADNPNTGLPFELQFANRTNYNVGANASWNLYDGGLQSSNIQNARVQEEITALSFLEAKASLNNQLDLLIENYNSQKDLIALNDEQVKLAEINLEMTQERFKNGQLTSLDFRNVQNQLLLALFNKANSIYDFIVTKSEIDFLVGKY